MDGTYSERSREHLWLCADEQLYNSNDTVKYLSFMFILIKSPNKVGPLTLKDEKNEFLHKKTKTHVKGQCHESRQPLQLQCQAFIWKHTSSEDVHEWDFSWFSHRIIQSASKGARMICGFVDSGACSFMKKL